MQIEYLSYHIRGRPRCKGELSPSSKIMPKRLEPFHGRRVNQYDHDDIGKKAWCHDNMKIYLRNCQGHKFDKTKEEEYLMHILEEARRRGGYSAVDDDILVMMDGKVSGTSFDHPAKENNEIDSDDLEEPYTQAMSNSDSDDDLGNFRRGDKKCEPMRPGDVIEYYSPMFVCGK